MKNQSINFKTIGFIAIEGRKVISNKIYKTKNNMLKAKAKYLQSQATKGVKQHLEVLNHALNINQLKNAIQEAQIKTRTRNIFAKAKAFFNLMVCKSKLYIYLAQLNKATKQFVNEFICFLGGENKLNAILVGK